MSELQMILWRDPKDQQLKLWACRGERKGCGRNKYRTSQRPCDECVPAHNKFETLGQLKARIERGDA